MTRPSKHIAFIRTASLSFVFLRGQIKYLHAAGYEVTCVSAPGAEQAIALEQGAHVTAVPMKREPSPLADLVSLWRLWRVLRKVKPHLVHAGTPKAGLLGSIAAKMAGVPVRVYSLMGLRFETLSGWRRFFAIELEKIACGCAGSVLCVSRSVRDRAIAEGLAPPAKCVLVGNGSSNGVDLDHFSGSPANLAQAESLRRELRFEKNEFVIGFVGRLVRDKGIAELLHAFEAVRSQMPAKLLLVGDFEEGDPIDEDLKGRLTRHEDVRIIPFLKDPAPVYHAIDVLALPTYREGFPNVVLEAQASGVPVVTTKATGAVDSIVDGETGYLVSVGSAGELAAALLELARDPEKRRAMGVAGLARVESSFAQKQVWSHLRDYYETMLQGASGQQGIPLIVKQVLDRVFALLLLALLSPFLVLAALTVAVTMGWPIVFRQPRIGRGGREIVVHKFRTMSQERDAAGELLPDEKRATRAGRFLRALSLDELPQLWDVLCGRMSFVGPRPLLVKYRDRYSPEQFRRHNVYPGITGWAQVNGRNTLSWEEKFKLDVWYVDHWSLWLDARILMRTVARVLKREGISQAGFEGAQEFLGSDRT